MSKLTREAERAAAERGHRLAGWTFNGATGWAAASESTCADCGAVATVEPTPAPNSITHSGTVYAWSCDGGQRVSQQRGWSGYAWEPVAYTHDGSAYCVGCSFALFSPAETAGDVDAVAACGRLEPVAPVFSTDRDALADSVCGRCRESAWAVEMVQA